MATDKHSVATDALATLGTIITDAEKRDAIHLAVEPVVAGVRLVPGDDVGLENGVAVRKEPYLGIVDPFLKKALLPGDRFWLVVYPRQIRSLRHVWEHPGFPAADAPMPAPSDKAASEKWLREYLERTGAGSYENVLSTVEDHHGRGSLVVYDGGSYEEIPPEFWAHIETVTGRTVAPHNRATHFSCTC